MNTARQQKFLAVEVSGHGYGIPTECVKEIVYHSRINPLPQTPAFVRGVTLIRNETMPVLDLNILLGKEELTVIHNESCFIVIQLANKSGSLTQICLLADRILQTYKIDSDDVDGIPQIDSRTIVEYVKGVARFDDEIFIVIEPSGLISPYLDEINAYEVYKGEQNHSLEVIEDNSNTVKKQKDQVNKYLSASVNAEEYAIPLNNVYQVVGKKDLEKYSDDDLPGFLTSATIINKKAVGIIRLRDVLEENENSKADDVETSDEGQEVVILVDFDDSMLGIVVDKIGRTYETHEALKQHSLCSDLNRNRIKSLGFIESDSGSIEVIEPTGVLLDSEKNEVQSWMGCVGRMLNMSDLHNKVNDKDEQKTANNPYAKYADSYLVVEVGEHLVAIKNDDVDEVLTFDDLIPLSNGPSWFMGLLDLRKSTYPVINMLLRLDVDEVVSHADEQHKVLVMIKNKGEKIALYVNRIVNSSHINETQLQSAEHSELYLNNEALFATAKLDAGCVHVINMEKIVSDEEISARRLLNELQAQSGNKPGTVL